MWNFKWGCFSYPAVEGGVDGTNASNYGAQVFAINKNSKNAEAAFQLICKITKGEFDQVLAEESNGIPADTTNTEWPAMVQCAQPVMEQLTVRYPWAAGAEDTKAFEQCAGFLRIPQAENPLDNTAVHPESYCIVEQMAKDLGCSVAELIASKELRLKIKPEKYLTPTVGMPTLKDILQELEKPGRDPRGPIKIFEFDKNVRTINDLREGMELPGIVGNITNFGAFVDIGIKENGLIHLSQLADRFVSDPNEIVSIHQHVRVKVLSVDMDRKRIALKLVSDAS